MKLSIWDDIATLVREEYLDGRRADYSALYGFFLHPLEPVRIHLLAQGGTNRTERVLAGILTHFTHLSILGCVVFLNARRKFTIGFDTSHLIPINIDGFYKTIDSNTPHIIALLNTHDPDAKSITELQEEYAIPEHVKMIP